MNALMQDITYAIRMLRKNFGFTVVAVLTLGLAIGANTAIFSVVNAVLLRPLPYQHPDRLVFLSETSQQVSDMSFSMADFSDWRAMNSVFESMVAYQGGSVTLTGHGQPEALQLRRVTSGLFSTLGVKPILGRPLGPDDDKISAPAVVMLSDTLWSTQFARDPNVIGKQLTLDGEPFTIISVLPSSHFHETWRKYDVYTSLWRLEDSLGGAARRDDHPGIFAYALLKPGVTVEKARAQMISIAAQLAKQYPKTNTGNSAIVQPLLGAIVEDVRPSLLVLMGAVGFVLLIGCANVANLLMARATERQREVAIRKALGAGRWRLARQLLTESVLLAFLGGVLGLFIAWWATQGLATAATGAVPRIGDISVDGNVLAFTLVLSFLTGIFFGMFPVLRASRTDVNDALKENTPGSGTGRTRMRLRDSLVIGELAISLVLVVGAGLTLESLFNVLRGNPGFKTDGVLTARFSLPDSKYKSDEQRRQFGVRLAQKIAAIPGVQAAGIKNPLLGGWQSSFVAEGQPMPTPENVPEAEMCRVTPGALEAMNAELIRGRYFSESDTEKTAMVAIVDDKLAAKYWPGENAVGKHVFIDEPKPGEQPAPTTIVGVIREMKDYGVDVPILAEIYLPFAQRPGSGGYLVIRSNVDASGLAAPMRAAAESLDSDMPVYEVRSLQSYVAENVAPRRLSVLLLSLFAGLALLLAAVGIYGVISYSVTQRNHEIGIRMALGASPRDVLALIVGQGARLVGAGVMIGVGVAFALTRVLSSLLFGVKPGDLLTYLGVVTLLAMIALAAGYIPARRASRTSPLVALRYE